MFSFIFGVLFGWLTLIGALGIYALFNAAFREGFVELLSKSKKAIDQHRAKK